MAVSGSTSTARLCRIIGCHTLTKTILTFSLLFITIPGFFHPLRAEQYLSDSIHNNDSRRICSSMDIRNSLEPFKKLEYCEVIEGFLSILLIENIDPAELSQISFPRLTEITDYLLMYRVNGLRSIGQLFPNLSVIRGSNTFLNKALVIFEMSTLQEIGLYSLTAILKGQVYIDKNPSLCFVKSIDWSQIVREQPEKNILKSQKPRNECPLCPSVVKIGNKTVQCPMRSQTDRSGTNSEYLCWDKNHCQIKCPSNCTACNERQECCKKSCLACRNDDSNICTVCPKLTYRFDEHKECLDNCPAGLYEFSERRCINQTQCLQAVNKPLVVQTNNYYLPKPYKIHMGKCLMDCPAEYMEVNSTCKKCSGNCKKICPGMNIDSIAMSKKLRGCTHINGSLEVQIRGGANITELEENLKMIEEISGYLKVVRSFSLLSLNFLKHLKRIKGEQKENDKYVFTVRDNQNLQDLWDWTNRTIEIDSGRLFFHANPKLCYDKIVKLQQIAKLDNFTELEVAKNSNGDKVACNIVPLNVTVLKIESQNVTLYWEAFIADDYRKLLAYTISYVEAPYKNVSLYDGIDACGQDKWNIIDLPNREDVKDFNYTIPKLNAYTQYAFYVKTYTIAQEKKGAQSEIMYFQTLPGTPQEPIITSVSATENTMTITWQRPWKPNGPITHYKINVTKKFEKPINSSTDINHCNDEGKMFSGMGDERKPTPKPKLIGPCNCEGEGSNKKTLQASDESEATEAINFQNEFLNLVYVRRKSKRDTAAAEALSNVTHKDAPPRDTSIIRRVNGTQIVIDGLHHFTTYNIFVHTCRRSPDNETGIEECSENDARETIRTKEKVGANTIGNLTVLPKGQDRDSVSISWDPPKDPNGDIHAYIIQYRRTDIPRAKATSECHNVTNKTTTQQYTITKLSPGNYSLLVYAKTLLKSKDYSNEVSFLIPEQSPNVALIVSTVIVLLIAIAILGFIWKKQQKKIMLIAINADYVPSVYIKDDWEVSRNNIEQLKELGQGSFGMVWEGLAHDIRGQSEVRCAIKTVNEHATDRERLEFLTEASIMKAFDTTHVVKLLGVVSEGQPTLVIMELMANGDLKSYLRSHRPDIENYNPSLVKHPPSLKQILQMAIEIADGMAYLSAMKFVHRDLAARNCMVSEDLVVKIGDFGMTRDIYETDYYRKGTKGLLPVRWMAPESLKDGVFTSSSDVWSYGVVLWEMATLASQPYQGLSNDQVLRYVIDGGVMERPENCPDKLYTLMRYCWQHKPSSRPTFLKLCQLLLEDTNPSFAEVSFYHSPAGIEARASRHTPSPSQDEQSTPFRTAVERLKGYTPQSETSDDLDVIDTHHHFPSISESGIGVITTANGYVSGCPTNGAATTQC
ncbi:unnamed protein product [Phyllotreta striolata]|uniref:Tyrosine-protein kinase receptor n=1 Tax=Phyllotreta striolata TaxID=444603 RepID=A0A9N9TGQ5_PHYSR|nr:unnamed protein product [Phyllotreta striolata]